MRHLRSIGQLSVNVRSLERGVAFYRDVLGLEHLFSAPRLAFFRVGEVRLMLGTPERPEFDHPGSIIYFRVDDIEAAHRDLLARGMTFEAGPHLVAPMPDHDLWIAFGRDPDGNPLALMAERPKAVPR